MIKVIFLDIDNTLLDFDAYVRESLRTGFERFNLPKYEPWMYNTFKSVNDKIWCELERKEIDFETLKATRFNRVFKELGFECDGEAFESYFRAELNESTIPVDGAYELLSSLSDDYILCAASNGPYEQQMHRLEKANMLHYFDYIFISGQIGHSKPSREFFDYAFDMINSDSEKTNAISPAECIIIGDSLTSDIAGGHEYGMKTCFYSHHKIDTHDDRINYFVKELMQIPDIIKE